MHSSAKPAVAALKGGPVGVEGKGRPAGLSRLEQASQLFWSKLSFSDDIEKKAPLQRSSVPWYGDRTRQALFVQDNVSARLPNGLEARALQGSNELVGPEGG